MPSNKCKAPRNAPPLRPRPTLILAHWRARRASRALIEDLRGEIVAAARRPALYAELGAPDRLDGRFELVTLHAGLVLRRLTRLGGLGDDIAQDLVNSLFLHFDDTWREMAMSDVAVSKRLKTMKEAFYGRNESYARALDSGRRDELAAALLRNVYGGADGAESMAAALADLVTVLDAALAETPLEAFATGRFRFPGRAPAPGA
jgi:cytochrome b pre-mRNA-processing protein 3